MNDDYFFVYLTSNGVPIDCFQIPLTPALQTFEIAKRDKGGVVGVAKQCMSWLVAHIAMTTDIATAEEREEWGDEPTAGPAGVSCAFLLLIPNRQKPQIGEYYQMDLQHVGEGTYLEASKITEEEFEKMREENGDTLNVST